MALYPTLLVKLPLDIMAIAAPPLTPMENLFYPIVSASAISKVSPYVTYEVNTHRIENTMNFFITGLLSISL